jgi:MFS family permease
MAPKILIDFAPLRESRDFRLLFIGQLVSTLGSQLTVVAIPFQIYRETHSSLQVGLISIVQLVPMVVFSLIGGSVGDAVDRRLLIIFSTLGLMCTSAGLALNALPHHPSIWALYLISAVAAGLTGFSNPARNAAIPLLVDSSLLVAAFSYSQVIFQVGTVVGPAVAGVLIAHTTIAWVYSIDAITFVVTIATTLLMSPIPPTPGAPRPGLGSILEGLRYLRGRPAIQGTYLIDINAMVFGMPRALFPALAANVFGGGPTTLGWLYAAPGAGALIGAVTTGWVSGIVRRGHAVTVSVIIWGAAITAFGFSHILGLSLAFLAVAGWADVISAVLRNTILQSVVPDSLRSRISSIQMAVVQGGPRVGDLEAGGVASALGNEFSIVSGGIACIVGALAMSAFMPGFRRHRSDEIDLDQYSVPLPES